MEHAELHEKRGLQDEEKKVLRLAARRQRCALSAEALYGIGLRMCDALTVSPLWQNAAAVTCFYSIAGEPNTVPLLQAALDAGKRLYLPRCVPGCPGEMQQVRVTSLAQLRPQAGNLQLTEPLGDEVAAPGEIDLALLPCLAADARGARLGHGGGYYDRFLAVFGGESVILCPQALVWPCVPEAPHDRRAGWLLTESGLLAAGAGQMDGNEDSPK